MEMTSYDELLKQVRSLRAENSNLRQELTDNTSHLNAIETEASGVTDAMATDPLDVDDDSDNDINYDENGIHVFQQGGGGEGRDLISSVEEDISPNDVYGLKPFHLPPSDTSQPQNGLAPQACQDRLEQQTYNNDVHTEILEHVKALMIERSEILRQIQDEDQQRKWYIAQLDNIRQKLEKIPYHDGYNRQSEAARGKVEYEAKQLQESFEQRFGTQEQISQRQDIRRQRVHAIESTVRQIQQQHRDKIDLTSLEVNSSQDPLSLHNVQMRKSRDESISCPGVSCENGDTSTVDPAVMNLASLYHGAWPLSPMKRDSSSHSSREGSAQNVGQEVASVMSFNSNSTHNSHPPGAPRQLVPMAVPPTPSSQPQPDSQQPQHFGTKVEMVYSLLSMLGSNDKDDMSRTLLAMSSSQDSCIAMRQSGCLPLLIQLLHGSDKDSGLLGNTRGSKAARARAAAALHNIVHSHPDDKRGRREARVLRLLEQIRAHCDQLRESMSEEDEEGKGQRDVKSPSDMDHHPGPAVAALMKLSFDEEHRHAICSLGGVQAIAELIQVDQEAVGNTSEQYNITMRRYGCMALTNLTFGDGTNKALLCSMRGFMTALVAQLESECEDLNQVSASVLRNLSWKADLQSKKTLRAVGVAATLMRAAMRVKKEPTLKSILSALWNLSAHGSENKADICAVDGALEFLVGTLTYKSPSKTTAVIENGGGVLRNISSHITVREDYRQILRKHGCLQILLKQLRSTSLNIVSNACGTLWNLSARCPEDQQALWDMGAVGMLRNLVHSKHQMIAMGSSAALKNLLSAGPTIKSTGMDKKAISNRPSLHVRKQKALVEEIDHSLAETCENLESPRDSPTENNRTEKDNTHFKFPLNPNVVPADAETRRLAVRDHIYPQSKSGENTPMSDSRLMSPSRVARSGSQDSVGSTHSDISHDRSRFHIAMKAAKQYHDRKGGSLDRNCGGTVHRFNSDGSCERNNAGAPGSSRILQVMKEVANYAGIESENQRNVPPNSSQCSTPRKDQNFSLPHALLYRSYTGPSHSFPVPQNHVKPQPGNFHVSQHEDDQQPIDYSMKYVQKSFSANHSSSQGPPVPMYGNFMSPRSDNGTVVMQNSFQGNVGNASQKTFHMHQMAPVIPQLSAYAETDLDSDQPVDYSLRYAESHEFMKDRTVSYGAQFSDTTQNCADYKYQVARRTNDLLEQYSNIPGYDDQVKTFCTEGTPRNYLSTANSLTDLSNKVDGKVGHSEEQNEEDNSDDHDEDLEHESHRSGSSSIVNSQTADGDVHSGSASLSTNQNTSTTLLANYHVATKNLQQVAFGNASKTEGTESHSFHAPSVNDHSPDQVKTYCEEGTPICFSRVSSLSSLHSGDYRDSHGHTEKDSMRTCKGLSKIKEHEGSKTPPRDGKVISSIMAPPKYTPVTGRQKMLSHSESHGPDSAEKEHKTVTFNDDNQVQETPLMFSRCSSLGSLSSFDAQSVHSSVVSDYSRRASEVVSPSELPDSPSETMPPSPSKSPEPVVKSNNQSNNQDSLDPPKISESLEGTPRTVLFCPKPRVEKNDTMKMKNAEISSTISCDEAPIVYADEGTPPHMSETNSVLSKLTIDDAERKKSGQKLPEESEKDVDSNILNQSDDKENSSMSEVSEGEEDILKQCMSSALPPKMRRSSSDNTIKKKTIGSLREHQKSRHLKPIEDKVNSYTSKGKSSYNGSQSQHDDPQDTVKLFASEDIPGQSVNPQFSKCQTDATVKTKTSTALVNGKHQGFTSSPSTDNCDDTVKSYAEEDLPFNEKSQKMKVTIPKSVQKGIFQENESSPDYVCSYANEGLPSSNTKLPRSKPKHFGKIQEILQGNLDHLEVEGDSMMSFAVEDTPFSGSVPISPQTASTTGPHFGKFDPKMLEKVDNLVDDEEPKSYACEDTPYNVSQPTSPKPTVKKAPPPVMQKPKRIPRFNPAHGYGSALLAATQDCPVDEEMPKSYAVEDTPVTSEPTSPKRQGNKITSQYGYLGSLSNVVTEIPCDDSVKHYATEDTPVNFSHTTSLSDLSIITSNEPIKEDVLQEENMDEIEPKENSSREKEEIGDLKSSDNDAFATKDEHSNEPHYQNVNEEDSNGSDSDNSSSLDDSEDLLSDIIQSAMPKGKISPKHKVSRKLDMDRAAEGAESLESKSASKAGFHPLRTSSLTSQIPQRKNTSTNFENVNISNISEQHSKLWQQSGGSSNVLNSSYSVSQVTSVSEVHNNGMPSAIQQVSSFKTLTSQTSIGTSRSAADDSVFYHTNESSDSLRHYNVEGTPQTFSRNDSLSSLSVIDEDMRDPCTQSTKLSLNSFTKLPIRTSKEIEMQREVEGQSSDETKSISNKTDSGQKSDDNKSDSEGCQTMHQLESAKEGSAIVSSSGSHFMSDKPEKKDDDTDEDDDIDEALQDALLEECMNSALPKSRSRTFDEKPKSVQTVPTMTNIPNKGPHLIKPDARKRASRASLDSNVQMEKTMQIVVQTKGKDYVFDKYKQHRLSRSCSSADEMEVMNLSKGNISHDSRAAQFRRQQINPNKTDFQFVKPPNDYRRVPPHGSWRRSRSQDSDGFLKRQKDSSNLEIAQSYGRIRQSGNSQQSIPTYIDTSGYYDNRMLEEQQIYIANYRGSTDLKHSHEILSDRIFDTQEKIDHEKLYASTHGRSRHYSLPQNDELEMMNRSVSQREHNNEALIYNFGIDNLGFETGGSSENVQNEDSADVTLQGIIESSNNTMCADDDQSHIYPHISFDENISVEDQKALEIDASLIVSAIQNNRMMGSSVDEDMFIENETLSLVSGGYMSDTPSDVSVTWSVHSENISESTTLSLNDDNSNSTGPRIIKPSDKPMMTKEVDEKGVRGRRKPLYSPRTSTSVPEPKSVPDAIKGKRSVQTTGRGRGRDNLSVNYAGRRPVSTKTHPQASSTPTKSTPPKSKLQKPSPPQRQISNTSLNKSSPSRLPLASTKKSNNSAERPKPPIKQGTFTKQNSQNKNVPVIDLDGSVNTGVEANDSLSSSSRTWTKALESYNFVRDNSVDEKKENQAPKKKGTANSTPLRKGSDTVNRNKFTGSNQNLSKNVRTVTKPTNSSTSNLRKTYSGSSLTKSGSGQSLNKSGSGSMLNKTGSKSSLNKSVSGASLNKASSDRVLNRSNPSLCRKDLNKSDSNASLKSCSRPTTPVSRKGAGTQLKKEDSIETKNRTIPSGKKQVNSKIAGLWKKEDSNSDSYSPRTSASKLPLSYSTPSRIRQPSTHSASKGGKSPAGSKAVSQNNMKSESPCDGMSRSSTYDKIKSINDASQIPCLEEESTENTRQIAIEMTQGADASGIKGDYVELRIIQGAEQGYDPNRSIIISSPTSSDIRTPTKSDSCASSKSPIVSPAKSETIPSPFGTNCVSSPTKSEESSSGRQSMSSSLNKSADEFDLKSLEKRIDTSTWRKKKSDLDSSCLPNADETEKSLEAVKALLDASVNSQNITANSTYSSLYNSSTIEGSYLSQGSRTVDGAAWRRFKEQTLSNIDQSEDEGESVWVRRDPESSKSEPELNKHLLNGKKGTKKEKTEGGKSFLPIKAMKSMFTSSKKEKSSKSGSKMSLSSSKESLYSHKIDMNEIVKAVEKEKEKRDKQEERRKQKEEKEREKERLKELEKEKQREKLKQKELQKEKYKEAANEAKKLKVNEKEKSKVKAKEKSKTEKVSRKSVSSEHDEISGTNSDESHCVISEIKNELNISSVAVETSTKPAKSSPQSALVPPFNYTPKENAKTLDNREKDESVPKPPSVKPPTTTAASPIVSSASPMTKTEMLLARRQQAYKNSLNKSSMENSDLNTTTEKDKRGCMVTTV